MDAWEKKQEAARRRRELRDRAIAYLGGSCRICGYNKCASAFDFHHINSLEKDFTISDRMTSWEAIEAELKKCVLLCSNCHREVHDGLHAGFLEDDSDRRGWHDREDWLDPTVTDEEIREVMESRPDDPFNVPPPTVLDLLKPLG